MDKSLILGRIDEELAKVEVLITQYRDLTKPISPENAIGRVSRMDAINNKSVNDAALRKAEAKLNNLTIAKGRINDPDFGICVRCKNPIPIERILLLPQVISCVGCTR